MTRVTRPSFRLLDLEANKVRSQLKIIIHDDLRHVVEYYKRANSGSVGYLEKEFDSVGYFRNAAILSGIFRKTRRFCRVI